MADALDHSRLRKLHERATRTGSEYDRDTFARAAFAVVPEMLAERDRLWTALTAIGEGHETEVAEDVVNGYCAGCDPAGYAREVRAREDSDA